MWITGNSSYGCQCSVAEWIDGWLLAKCRCLSCENSELVPTAALPIQNVTMNIFFVFTPVQLNLKCVYSDLQK